MTAAIAKSHKRNFHKHFRLKHKATKDCPFYYSRKIFGDYKVPSMVVYLEKKLGVKRRDAYWTLVLIAAIGLIFSFIIFIQIL